MNRTRRPLALGRSITKALGALGLLLALGAAPACTFGATGQLRGGAVVAYEAPPPPRQEAYESRAGHVWIKGRWDMQNGQWQWVPGHWERERAGYAYQDGRWEQRNGQYHWIEGQWVVGSSGSYNQGNGVGHGYGNEYRDQREQVRDHRDGQPGTGTYVPPPPSGGQGPLTASAGGNTVVVRGGQVMVYPTSPPPPVRVETPGTARGGHVWIRGNWQWSNGQYEWVPGHWEREKAGYHWYDGEWRNQNGQWIWVQGEWRAQAQVQPQVQIRDRRTH